MSKKKEIRCYTSLPLVGVTWADVWISWHNRRERVYKGPTLVTRVDLLGDMEITQACIAKHPELDFEQEARTEARALAALDRGEYFHAHDDRNDGCPTIYTPKDSIDHAEAERMLRDYLETWGVTNASLRWKKNKGPYAWPVSVGGGA